MDTNEQLGWYTVGMTNPKTHGNKLGGRQAFIDLTVTDEDFEEAQTAKSHSGRCMIAHAISAKYGKNAKPIVDSDFIRLTNPETGDRLFFRTPPAAAAALISFDAGIKPQFPIRFRANIAFERRARRRENVSNSEVRAWAKQQSQFDGRIADEGPLSRKVADAYRAEHPGKKIHTQKAKAISSRATCTPKMSVGTSSQPLIGNLSNVGDKVPATRRRTWGSRTLTKTLIEQGWIIPDNL